MCSLAFKYQALRITYTLARVHHHPPRHSLQFFDQIGKQLRRFSMNTKMETASPTKETSALTPSEPYGPGFPHKECMKPDYSRWSVSRLIDRITELERQLHDRTTEFTSNTAYSSPSSPSARPAKPEKPIRISKPRGTTDPSPDDFTRVGAPGRSKLKKENREIDPSKYHTRFIALKFAYLGQKYNGYEHANGNITPLSTIEEQLWKALRRARLIFPTNVQTDGWEDSKMRESRAYDISWEGCEYSKCGRTDRGVSAFGQVVGVRVRSARPNVPVNVPRLLTSQHRLERKETAYARGEGDLIRPADEFPDYSETLPGGDEGDTRTIDFATELEPAWDDIADELPYISILNNLLPEDIRVLAWCPHPPINFDARFSCRERQYRYFFTQPAFAPTPGPLGFFQANGKETKLREGWLDIEAMREAAKHFVGTHDFRNFCKVDTSKQINNFKRIIYHADIELVDPQKHPLGYLGDPEFQSVKSKGTPLVCESRVPDRFSSTPQIYSFRLHGSAFLWHQVRHMVAILFLIGQGLESPSIIPELLDISKNPCKPLYEMASDAPLVLWDCIFPDPESKSRDDALEWVYAGDAAINTNETHSTHGKYTQGGLVERLWSVWRQRKLDEVLTATLLNLVVDQGSRHTIDISKLANGPRRSRESQRLFTGGNVAKLGGPYVPVLKLRRSDPVEVQNARYLASKKQKATDRLCGI